MMSSGSPLQHGTPAHMDGIPSSIPSTNGSASHQSPAGVGAGAGAGAGAAGAPKDRDHPVDRQAEELRKKRRQEEVNKARMMMEIVGEKERKELEAMFPELVESPSRSRSKDFFLDEADEDILPKAYVFMGPELVETELSGGDTDIDFGLDGCRIQMRDFVGLRPIHQFSRVHALPANFIPEKDPTALEAATKLATNLGESLKHTWQWIADKKPFGLQLPSPRKVLPHDPVVILPDGTDGSSDISQFQAMAAAAAASGGIGMGRGQAHASVLHGAPTGQDTVRAQKTGSQESQRSQDSAVPDPYANLGKWEIVWKDHTMLGIPARRLEFACNAAGLAAIRERMANWQELATSAAAMLEASQAALKACGGVLPENPGVWLPAGIPESAIYYLSMQEKEDQGRNGKENGGEDCVAAGANGTASASAGAGASASASVSTPSQEQLDISISERDGPEHLPRLASEGGMTAAEMAAAGVGEGENVIRWGSVSVAGKFMPKRNTDSLILRPGQFMALAVALPARLRRANWTLAYSTARDGISLGTMYRKLASRRGPCLLIVRDSQKYVFGSFTNEEWKPMTKYYGNGECFVFQAQPLTQAFRWTHANSYFMFSTPNSLAIGGGNHYAFSLNSDLLSGYSGQCETFGSLPLAGSEEFEAVLVEVWNLR